MDIENLLSESVALLREMIAIPSPTFEEEKVCSHIAGFLDSKGLQYERIANSLIIRRPDHNPERQTLMLCAHCDTVSPADGYSFDPYQPAAADVAAAFDLSTVDADSHDDIIAGLGSNDDGGCVVSMIAAYRALLDERFPFNIEVVISSEEERSGNGGMALIHPKNVNPTWAIVGEPTGMKPATSERGLLVLDGVAEGVTCHAARAEEGRNALYIAMDDIAKLRAHKFERVSPTMGEVKMNVTQINAGSAHNVIPGTCSFVVDIRPTEQYSNPELLEEIQDLCESKLTARNLKNRSSATPKSSLLMAVIGLLGLEQFSSPTTSDWVRIYCEAVKMGPGDSRRSHHKDEFITVNELRRGVNGYIDFIKCLAEVISD